MATNDPPYPVADPSLAYDLAKNELSIQISAIDALDSKIAIGISLATTLAAITLAFLGIRAGQGESLASFWGIAVMAATAIAYCAALSLFVVAIRNRSMELGLRPKNVWDVAHKYDPRVLSWWATSYFMDAVSANDKPYRQKLTFGTYGYATTALQLLLGAAAILTTFN